MVGGGLTQQHDLFYNQFARIEHGQGDHTPAQAQQGIEQGKAGAGVPNQAEKSGDILQCRYTLTERGGRLAVGRGRFLFSGEGPQIHCRNLVKYPLPKTQTDSDRIAFNSPAPPERAKKIPFQPAVYRAGRDFDRGSRIRNKTGPVCEQSDIEIQSSVDETQGRTGNFLGGTCIFQIKYQSL